MTQEDLEVEHPHDIVEFSKSQLRQTTSRKLENFKHTIEGFFLDRVGKITQSEMYDFDEELADAYFKINDVLRERSGTKGLVDDIHDRINDMDERTTGMQKAIDDLKEHTHEKLDTGIPKRDF